jgi:HlyD family secretion protein
VRNSPTTVNNVVTYDCVIGVTNADYKLKPGMTANVSIVIARRENVLKILNSAFRFRPPETAAIANNTNAPASRTNRTFAAGGNRPGGFRGGFGGGGHGRGERPNTQTIYVLAGNGADAELKSTQIKTGITDRIYTEVLDGLKEGDLVVTGATLANAQTTSSNSNPLGGGFPRMR